MAPICCGATNARANRAATCKIASTSRMDQILQRYLERTPRSREMAAAARQVIPGGIVTDTRFFEPYGIYVQRGVGTHKWDVDFNEYLDLFGGHGANMLGHAPRVIVDAVRFAVGDGVQFAANGPLEIELAESVSRMVRSAQRVRFTGSGTEATMLAIRLARAYTGRKQIVRFATHYHGWHDHAVSGYVDQFDGSPAPGVLAEISAHTVLLPPDDPAALERAVETQGRDIAAFIVEPVGAHFGVVPISSRFLHSIEAAARSVGAIFVLDEILSGFRVAPGGAQSVYGLNPDLTTLAKVLCGGMPGGAVAGRADILDLLDFDAARRGAHPKILHQGTFTGNPVSMAAGVAMLREIVSGTACAHANELGAYARDCLNAAAQTDRLPFQWYGEFSAFHLQIANAGERSRSASETQTLDPKRYLVRPQPLLNRLRMALNNLGIDVNTKCSGLLSAVHTKSEVDVMVRKIALAADMLRREGHLPA